MTAEASPTVLVASDDGTLLDEIVRYLDQIPSWKLVTSSGPVGRTLDALEAHLPDAALISDALAVQISSELAGQRPSPGTLIVVGRREDTDGLKAALRLGARAFIEWPNDRDSLKGLVENSWGARASSRSRAGRLCSVWSPKGGSGASTIAAHLAASLAALDAGCILADIDFGNADQAAILGIDENARHLGDLVRMGGELSANIIDEVAVLQPEGFRAILAPQEFGAGEATKPAELIRALTAIREAADFVVADLPSGLGETTLAVLDQSEVAYLVLTPDLLSVRRARDAVKVIRSGASEVSRLEIILNQTGHGGISAKDVESVVGLPVVRQVKAEVDIYHAPNRGRLSDAGKKALTKLARSLVKAAEPTPRHAKAKRWR